MDINNDNSKHEQSTGVNKTSREKTQIKAFNANDGKYFSEDEKQNAFDYIITEILNGKGLPDILKNNKDYTNRLPSAVTFFNWMRDTPQLNEVYRYAREVQSHTLFDELLTIAKGTGNADTVVHVQRDRLITDTMKFYIAKVLPKVYGEKIDVTSGGEAINVVSLGVGIAPTQEAPSNYIDVTERE